MNIQELNAQANQLFNVNITTETVQTAVGHARLAFAEEIPALNTLRELSPEEVKDFCSISRKVTDVMRNGSDDEVNAVSQYAINIGFLVGGLVVENIFKPVHPIDITADGILTDGHSIAVTTRMFLDHGIGLNGMAVHNNHLTRQNSSDIVYASAGSEVEVLALEGMAKNWGIPNDRFIANPDILETTHLLLEEKLAGTLDVVVVSRVHTGNKAAMREALKLSPRLLKSGGVVIIRGAQSFNHGSRGLNVGQQAAVLSVDRTIEQEARIGYGRTHPHLPGVIEADSTYVFRKR